MKVGNVVLELPPSRHNPRNSEGAFVNLKDGRILFAYSKFNKKLGSDDDPAEIAVRYSSDRGCTWSVRDRIIVKNEGRQNVMCVSLLRLHDGRIALFYARKNGLHDCRLRMRVSEDEALTWSEPVLVIPAPGYFVVNNDRVIQLTNGRLIVPAAFHRQKGRGNEDFRNLDMRGIAIYFLSDDGGRTWRESKTWWALPAIADSGLQEPGVVELKDGRLFSWCRTDMGCQYGMYSTDQGDIWSLPCPTQFQSPRSPLSIKQIPATGDLLAVWNDRSGRFPVPADIWKWGRTPLVSAISHDQGNTWQNFKLIENDPDCGFCYIAIHFPDKKHVLLAYCAGNKKTYILSTLRIRRIRIKWFYS